MSLEVSKQDKRQILRNYTNWLSKGIEAGGETREKGTTN